MPQQRKKKERSERLREERDQIKFIDLGFTRWQVVRFRKARGRQDLISSDSNKDLGKISQNSESSCLQK